MTNVQKIEAISKEIMEAIISCSHEIDHGSVVLKFHEKATGHNAYSQLHHRVSLAVAISLGRHLA